jgi:hypothetical protein
VADGFPGIEAPPADASNIPYWLRRLWTTFQTVQQGKLNAVGSVTFATGTTVTTVSDPRIGPQSYIDLMPTSSASASATWNVSARSKGSCSFAHVSSATTTVTFDYLIIG